MKKRFMICAGISIVILAIVIFGLVWRIWLTVPTPPPYDQGEGAKYAKDLAELTQRLSLLHIVVGWVLVISGGALATAGAVLGSGPSTPDNRTVKAVLASHRGVLCTVLAVALGGIGWQCIDRSTSATKTASVATAAIATATAEDVNEPDRRAYKACVAAKSAWLEGRMNHDRLQSIVEDMRKK
jgi:hypothetical protein